MKLRNKKTGEIVRVVGLSLRYGRLFYELEDERGVFKREINSLAELNEEWEDYEEAKENYVLNFNGDTLRWDNDKRDRKITKQLQEIGNYFETKEEAEKAVEKLKAWKRLKDKEFEFVGCFKDNTINFEFVGHPLSYDEAEEAEQDLAFIFGGEE